MCLCLPLYYYSLTWLNKDYSILKSINPDTLAIIRIGIVQVPELIGVTYIDWYFYYNNCKMSECCHQLVPVLWAASLRLLC